MAKTITKYDELRDKWQPAPGSRLAVALEKADDAAQQWQAVYDRLSALQAKRARVQAELDAVGLDSDMAATAAAIGMAEALDLAIMRGKLELNRYIPAYKATEVDVDGIIESLIWTDRPVNDAARRWGEGSREHHFAQQEREANHMRYLATPERVPG